jgi:hypothetical protein
VKCRCPLCRHDQPLPLADRGPAYAANSKRLQFLPQSDGLIRTIKRSEQLEQALLLSRRVPCAFDSACECDAKK